ncbi:hypothetical protein [Neptunitalea lumnitzerae]|uniref:DUF1735 domain-containing protein n=1 Tax=Neptunitalea lumnitzerae TaxID=2965509 RepID=A0ABQ5MHF5_9FLAO|nr:hypothetical protein [Neptunitalea sp. Y10]GLB48823.1 hypothetical protein Y10_11910 [Neptunitalea sp. Y10]
MKKLKFYLVGLLAAASMTSCLLDDEVDPYTQNMDYIVGFDEATSTLSYFADEGVVTYYYPISLKGSKDGGTFDQDITLDLSVDPTSSAQSGVEYSFAANQVVLEAGSDYVLLPVDIHTGAFNSEMPTELVINISTNTEDTVVAAAYSSLTITFVGCISTIQEGEYLITFGSSSSQYVGQSYYDDVTMVDVNTFMTTETPPFMPGANYQPSFSTWGFEFTDVCGDLTVPTQNLFDYYSNEVYGVTTTDDNLTAQQGAVIDEDTFIIFMAVSASAGPYYSYLTFEYAD